MAVDKSIKSHTVASSHLSPIPQFPIPQYVLPLKQLVHTLGSFTANISKYGYILLSVFLAFTQKGAYFIPDFCIRTGSASLFFFCLASLPRQEQHSVVGRGISPFIYLPT
jgi:hypothetical protein